MKNATGLLLTLGLGALVGASALTLDSCRDNPLTQFDTVVLHDTLYFDSCRTGNTANLLRNGGFDLASSATHDLSSGEMSGWDPYEGTPQAVPGVDGRNGLLQMWGNAETGEGVVQRLSSPLVPGKQYQMSASFEFWHDNPANYTPYVRLRFIALGDNGSQETIGTVQTSSQTWVTMTTPTWTPSTVYTRVAVVVENDNSGENSASWTRLDALTLTAR